MSLAIRRSIRFYLNDRLVERDDVRADETLLDYLRLDRRLRGTKEGCAEGDCGACTVLVGRLSGGDLHYESVNACIRFVGSLDGCHVVTVEHLAGSDGTLHPVQQALVDHHGSQCGFCTPGFVMSAYGLWLESRARGAATAVDRPRIEKTLQGNLCRCTGYRPIVEAVTAACASNDTAAAADPITGDRAAIAARLTALRDGARVEIDSATLSGGRAQSGTEGKLILPADVDDLAAILEAHPRATIVAGATDVGLWVTKFMRSISPAVFIGHLEALHAIDETADGVTIGAAVTYTEAFDVLGQRYPTMADFLDRIGGEQVRNMGTIGGNIANGSPIGDMPPPLIALGTTVTLRKGAARRTLPLEDFFIDYGRQDRAPGEFVESLFVPALASDTRFAAYKISKRRDEDISAVCGAFALALAADGTVATARIAFGGMAATPKRAAHVEQALAGQPWNEATIGVARAAFERDFKPLTDWRASADYRMLSAKNLLTRFFLEAGGQRAQLMRHRRQPEEA